MSLPPLRKSLFSRLRPERPPEDLPEPAIGVVPSLFPPRPKPVATPATPPVVTAPVVAAPVVAAPTPDAHDDRHDIDLNMPIGSAAPAPMDLPAAAKALQAATPRVDPESTTIALAPTIDGVPPRHADEPMLDVPQVAEPARPREPAAKPIAAAQRPAAAPPPRPAADPQEAQRTLAEIRRLASVGQASAALALCEDYFGRHKDFLDAYRHPVYLKESVRLLLLLRRVPEAKTAAAQLQPLVAPTDPCVQVLFARYHAGHAERDAARAEWQAALARDPRNVEALAWLSEDEARKGADLIGGVAEFAAEATSDLETFAQPSRDQVLRLFGTLVSPPGMPVYAEGPLPPETSPRFEPCHVPRAEFVYAVHDAILTGPGFIIRDRQFIVPPGVFPDYLRGRMTTCPHGFDPSSFGALDRSDVEILRIDSPVAVALHPNLVWGHLLLEMLPRLFLLGQLGRMGRAFPLAVPSNVRDWVKQMAALYAPAGGMISYDARTQCLAAPSFILPTMLHDDYVLSPLFNLMVSDLLARCGVAEEKPGDGPRRIYLSRSRFEGGHRLLNEAEVEACLADMGFNIVHPETLPFEEQIQLYHGADIIVGEYSSALHNALFARRGTRVVALSWVNHLQGEIARLRGQQLALVQPSDGVWRNGSFKGERRNFSIDCAAMRRTIEHLVH